MTNDIDNMLNTYIYNPREYDVISVRVTIVKEFKRVTENLENCRSLEKALKTRELTAASKEQRSAVSEIIQKVQQRLSELEKWAELLDKAKG